MNYKIRVIRRKIENLRNDMILTFIQEGTDLNHPEVLRLSQLLDEQLNHYGQCVRYISPGKQIKVGPKPLNLSHYFLGNRRDLAKGMK
jgi:hypothetical protein